MNLKAVAFDVDGTLYPNSSMYMRSLPLVLMNAPLLKSFETVRKELREAPDTSDSFYRVQARSLAAQLDITPERAYALIEGRIYTTWFKIFKKLKPYRYLTETLQTIRLVGLKLAVMSDFPIRNRLTDLGLDGPWDCSFSSEETGYLKPCPQPFLEMARRLDLPPSQILYVGNSYRYDILGAHSVGMPCVHLSHKKYPDSPALLTFKTYRQLLNFILENVPNRPIETK